MQTVNDCKSFCAQGRLGTLFNNSNIIPAKTKANPFIQGTHCFLLVEHLSDYKSRLFDIDAEHKLLLMAFRQEVPPPRRCVAPHL